MKTNHSGALSLCRLILLKILIIYLVLLPGCNYPLKNFTSDALQDDTVSEGGSLAVAIESKTDILDPHIATGWVSFRVLNQIYEGLVAEDPGKRDSAETSIVPSLAESWEVSPDGKVFTFHLRSGVKFHDGTPFDAEAVKYNLDRMYNKEAPQFDPKAARITCYLWHDLEAIDVLNSLTVRLKFRTPFYEFPRVLVQSGMGSGEIISPAALKKWGNKIGDHPVGTGPFKFWKKNNAQIMLVKNQDYWGRKAHLDQIIFYQLPDPVARVNALQTGEVDIIFAPPPKSIENLKQAGYVVAQGTTAHVWFLTLNTKDPAFKDIRVRKAITLAIDKDKLVSELLKNTAKPAQGLQAPGNSSFDPNFKGPVFDPVKARALMAEAGYPNGFDTVLQTSVSGSGQILPVQIARWIQHDLRRININVKIETYEWIKYINLWSSGIRPGIGINQLSWGMTANYWFDLIVNSDSFPPNGYNNNYYVNNQVNSLLQQALKEPDNEKRALLYRKVNELVVADAWHIPIINDLSPIVMSPKIKGFVHAPSEWYDYKTVWKSE